MKEKLFKRSHQSPRKRLQKCVKVPFKSAVIAEQVGVKSLELSKVIRLLEDPLTVS